MQENKILLVSIAILAFLVILPVVTAGGDLLFVDLAQSPLEQDAAVANAKQIAINWSALNEGRNRELRLNLFDGQTVTAVRDRLDRPAAGGYVWVGHWAGNAGSSVTLSAVDGVLIGRIVVDGYERYTIGHDVAGQVVREINSSASAEVELDDMVIVSPPANLLPEKIETCEDGTQIDLLVAYTKAARIKSGGTAAMRALINLRVSDMNSANTNSGLAYQYDLVHAMETDYSETGDVSIDLPRLKQAHDGQLDDVTAARDAYKADLTSLIVSRAEAGTSCGSAYVMNQLSTSFASYAYNVTALNYAGENLTCSSLTLAHEFGHNMGNLHDRASNNAVPLLPYSYGYQSPNETFRTIMAYNCPGGCPRINHWSNPDVFHAAERTGISYEVSDSKSADNARTMEQTARFVANFRENCLDDPAPIATSTPAAAGAPTATPASTSSHAGHKSYAPILFGTS